MLCFSIGGLSSAAARWLCLCFVLLPRTGGGRRAPRYSQTDCSVLSCDQGLCAYENCSTPTACPGGRCMFTRCVKPSCDGGACVFRSSDEPSCSGGGCRDEFGHQHVELPPAARSEREEVDSPTLLVKDWRPINVSLFTGRNTPRCEDSSMRVSRATPSMLRFLRPTLAMLDSRCVPKTSRGDGAGDRRLVIHLRGINYGLLNNRIRCLVRALVFTRGLGARLVLSRSWSSFIRSLFDVDWLTSVFPEVRFTNESDDLTKSWNQTSIEVRKLLIHT